MPKPGPLGPGAAGRSLVGKFSGTSERPGLADRLRQLHTKFGARSRRVFLVWTRFTGEERGEGEETVVRELELLPTPKVSDLTSVALNPYAAGKLPVGSIRVDEISAAMPEDTLLGRLVPGGGPVPEPYDFFYEIREDDRSGVLPARQRFRLLGQPSRKETNVSWSVLLERVSEDRTRSGASSVGVVDSDE